MNPESRERGRTGHRDRAERHENARRRGARTADRGEPAQAQTTRKSGRETGEGTHDKSTNNERERAGSQSAKATKRDRQGKPERSRTPEAGGREGGAQPHARRKSPRTRREGIPLSEFQGSTARNFTTQGEMPRIAVWETGERLGRSDSRQFLVPTARTLERSSRA